MSRRGGRGGGAHQAYRERVMMQERPPPIPKPSDMAPRWPKAVAEKGVLFTTTTVPLPPKKMEAILGEIVRRKKVAYAEKQKEMMKLAQKAHESMKDREPAMRVSGMSALEQGDNAPEDDMDQEFLSEDFKKNCTVKDLERLRKRVASLQHFQDDLKWLLEKVTNLEKKHKLNKYKESRAGEQMMPSS